MKTLIIMASIPDDVAAEILNRVGDGDDKLPQAINHPISIGGLVARRKGEMALVGGKTTLLLGSVKTSDVIVYEDTINLELEYGE